MPRPRKKTVIGIKLRVAAELLAQLEAAAKKNKHSFNAEAAMRLGKSFGEEAAFGGEAGRRFLHFFATAFVFAGERHYRDRLSPKQRQALGDAPNVSLWIDEPEAYVAAMMATIEQLMLRQPNATHEKCVQQLKVLNAYIATHFVNKSRLEKMS